MITNNEIFSLNKYYTISNKYYYFFDGMFKKIGKPKKEILGKLSLPSSTYRTNRAQDNIKNENHVDLLNYFEVNKTLNDQREYEKVISDLYSAIYYKQMNIVQALSLKINEFIDENNYLKPIFTLFRILINIIKNKDIFDIISSIAEDVDYISNFPDNYFENDFKILYYIIMFFMDKSDKCIQEYTIDTNYPHLSWLYHHLRGSMNFYKNNYLEAIIYYNNALKYYEKDLNVSRLIECKINISSMYNRINSYNDAINILIPLIEYSFYYTEDKALKCYSIMHCLFSFLMIEKYEKIIQIMENIEGEFINDISAMIAIIAYKKSSEKKINLNIKRLIKIRKNINEFYNYLFFKKEVSEDFKSEKRFFYFNKIKEIVKIC